MTWPAILPLLLAAISMARAQSPEWWTAYGDPELNRLVAQALASDLDLQRAAQRIAEARAVAGDRRSKLLPSLDFNTSAQQLRGGFQQGVVRVPQAAGGGAPQGGTFVAPFETGILQGGLDTRWELDLFGTNRAALAAARSDANAEVELRRDVAVTVAAEVARAYIELRGIEERLAITERSRASQKDLLDLTRTRAEAGLASALEVEQQTVLLANTEARLPVLEAGRIARRNRLAVLLGDRATARSEMAAPVAFTAPRLGAGIDSGLLRRRPDVRAAEARIAAALARLKQARAERYPRLLLTGSMGRQSTSLGGLSLGGGNFFSVGPRLELPIFNGGRIRSNIEANDARAGQARIAYEQELLAAFEEAENAIAAYREQQVRAGRLENAAAAAARALDLSRDRNTAGVDDFLSVLDAQRSLFDAEYQLSESRTQALVESVQLYKALAGGWPQ